MNRYCPFCKGEVEPGKTTFTSETDSGIVVVREVPAMVCTLCGADWITDSIADQLEKIVSSAKQKRIMVEITNWQYPLTTGEGKSFMKDQRESAGSSHISA